MTSNRPSTATEHADEARRLAGLIRPTALESDEVAEYLSFENPTAVLAAAQVHATLALVEEQRTANLIAAFERDAISSPFSVPTKENRAFWDSVSRGITRRVGLA